LSAVLKASDLHAIEQAWFPIPACDYPFGAWPVIGVKFEKHGLPFVLLPRLQLLTPQIA
jgi:hypothetical protein